MPVDGFILLQSAACVKSQAVTVVETITEPSEQFHLGHDSELKGAQSHPKGAYRPLLVIVFSPEDQIVANIPSV